MFLLMTVFWTHFLKVFLLLWKYYSFFFWTGRGDSKRFGQSKIIKKYLLQILIEIAQKESTRFQFWILSPLCKDTAWQNEAADFCLKDGQGKYIAITKYVAMLFVKWNVRLFSVSYSSWTWVNNAKKLNISFAKKPLTLAINYLLDQ